MATMSVPARNKWVSAARVRVSIIWAAVVAIALTGFAMVSAPYLFAELSASLEPHSIIDPAEPSLSEGRMVDDYWVVQKIDANTYALGEPRYYQANYSYLIVGERRALLFDAGSGTRDTTGVVTGLTHLPVTVMPSHLHYDHSGGIAPFSSIAMIDIPDTRADIRHGEFTPRRYEYLGMIDNLEPPTFRVTEWVKPGTTIDLGGRGVRVLSVPGHTHSSAALYDAATHQQLIYALELRSFVQEAFRLERLRNLRNQTPSQTAEIRKRSEYPYGRYSKRD